MSETQTTRIDLLDSNRNTCVISLNGSPYIAIVSGVKQVPQEILVFLYDTTLDAVEAAREEFIETKNQAQYVAALAKLRPKVRGTVFADRRVRWGTKGDENGTTSTFWDGDNMTECFDAMLSIYYYVIEEIFPNSTYH